MKTSIALILACVCLSGCASPTSGNTTTSVATQVAIIADVTQTGADLAVTGALTQKPTIRPYLEASREALNALLASGNTTTPTQLQAYLNQSVPAEYQALADAALRAAMGAYETWYAANSAKLTADQNVAYTLQILTALDAGLNAGLGPQTTSTTTNAPLTTNSTAQ